jgi:uncharacterized membrane protein
LILLVVLVAGGLAARLYEIHYNFDGDEIFSVKLAGKPFSDVIESALQDRPHPPLYYILLHIWIKAFGSSEVSARAMSVLFSGAFLLTSYALLRRFVATWIALGLLSIFALSPLFVYYGQQARPYALVAFFAAANLLAFTRLLDLPSDHKRVAAWATSCALLLYTQYLALVIIAFQIALAFYFLPVKRVMIFAYGFVASSLILPWLIAAMGGPILGGADPLTRIRWMQAPTGKNLISFYVATFGEAPGLTPGWMLLMLGFLGAAYVRGLFASRHLPARHALLFVIGLGLPAVVYVVSVWGPKPLFAPRQMLAAPIALVAAIGLCLTTLPRAFAFGSLLILIIWTASALPRGFPHNLNPPWRDLAQRIDEQHGSVTVVTQEIWVKNPLDFYRRLGSVRLWNELTELKENDKFLFVCRPVGLRCSNVESEAVKPYSSLLGTWRWGRGSQLRVYEIKGVPKLGPD